MPIPIPISNEAGRLKPKAIKCSKERAHGSIELGTVTDSLFSFVFFFFYIYIYIFNDFLCVDILDRSCLTSLAFDFQQVFFWHTVFSIWFLASAFGI